MEELNNNSSIDVGTTSVVVSKSKEELNSKRINIILINNSVGGQKITLSIDSEAKDGQGIVLSPGGYWSDSTEAGYKPTQKSIHAISNLADGILSIQERLIQ
jgi:hypothetical protein